MKFSTIAVAAAAFATASAGPIAHGDNDDRTFLSPMPGYPLGNGFCLTDAQANFLANEFKSVLTNPDRSASKVTAAELVATNYVETSDSIDILAGFPIGGPSFSGQTAFVQGVGGAPAIPSMTTLGVFHDCNNISWRWQVNGLGLSKYPVKGINDMYVPNVITGQLGSNNVEFNTIAWGIDTGYKCQTPTGQEL